MTALKDAAELWKSLRTNDRPPDCFTTSEYAEFAGISHMQARKRIYELIRKGLLERVYFHDGKSPARQTGYRKVD